jgi:hypothetical protein
MDRNLLVQLRNDGYSQYKIALLLGKSQTTVRYWFHKHQLGTQRVHRCMRCGEVDPNKFTLAATMTAAGVETVLRRPDFRGTSREQWLTRAGVVRFADITSAWPRWIFTTKIPARKTPIGD